MKYINLEKIINESGEDIRFSNGEIVIDESGAFKSWDVELNDVENGNYLEQAMRDKKQPLLSFIGENEKEYEGKVLISRYTDGSNGTYIEMTGNGQLKGY